MAQVIQLAPTGHYRVKHVVKSETLKILTLRSTAFMFALTTVAGLLVTGLVANSALHHDPGFYIGFDPTQEALIGLIVAGLTGGVFGALLITGEYASGTIRTTLAATPKRPALLGAKSASQPSRWSPSASFSALSRSSSVRRSCRVAVRRRRVLAPPVRCARYR